MSGGRFLVSVKDVLCSENILKIRSLAKENINIDETIKVTVDESTNETELISKVESLIRDIDSIQLSEDSRHVSDYIAGHISYKAKKICKDCCYNELVGLNDETQQSFLSLMSRGGLVVPSEDLSTFVAQRFALLDACSEIIRTSGLSSRKASLFIIRSFLFEEIVDCEEHSSKISSVANRIIINIFFNNQRKRVSETVVKDRLASFKKLKRSEK